MAQAEDNELRDLVIEALEKNGSLAKIRALLRANIFLAFEDGYDNIKQNVSLDNILNISEGSLCLSIVHEFLEFCNLKNTLFVYMSESRQGKEYYYEGRNKLAENLNMNKTDNVKEPIMITLIRNILKLNKKSVDKSVIQSLRHDGGHREDQNCTYIVHEDTSSQTNSENSSDEKNKPHLRLHFDNSDTDTSSDSTREKSSSEYMPNAHVIPSASIENKNESVTNSADKLIEKDNKEELENLTKLKSRISVQDNKLNTSSDTTSYVEIKSFNPLDQKLLNTTGLPVIENVNIVNDDVCKQIDPSPRLSDLHSLVSNIDTPLSATLSSGSLNSSKSHNESKSTISSGIKELLGTSKKSDNDSIDYSFDFTSSDSPKNKESSNRNTNLPLFEENGKISNKLSNPEEVLSPHQQSLSSRSSISISDVADLIDNSEDKSGALDYNDVRENSSEKKVDGLSNCSKSNNSAKGHIKLQSNDSEGLSESSVQSLSNLSLDVHSA